MEKRKSWRIVSNLLWLLLIGLLIIPRSRQVIQVAFHSFLSGINSVNVLEREKRETLSSFDWFLIDENTKRFHFSETKNKVVFINFWATWCPPCIAEMESLEKLYQAYKKEVIFLFVTSDDMSKVRAFKAKNQYSFPVYNPVSAIPKQLETSSIPRTFIISKNGEIVVDESGALDWNNKEIRNLIDELLKIQ